MIEGLHIIEGNLGTTIGAIIALLAFLASFISFATDFKTGVVTMLILSGCAFMLTYVWNMNYIYSIALMFLAIIGMVFSLYAHYSASRAGGIV